MFVILWEFEVKSGYEAEFEKDYGPEGVWVELFRQSPAYRETRLLRDTAQKQRYYTLDFWASGATYQAFRDRHREKYNKIDAKCEAMTVRETRLGEFESGAEKS